ncbi:hypothetical protein DM794_07175 [Paenarthrobacter ureafaciens]|nr:hypothetical protein [Paenarthrobacter ureafaciens]
MEHWGGRVAHQDHAAGNPVFHRIAVIHGPADAGAQSTAKSSSRPPTNDVVFTPEFLVSYISTIITLYPGDVIATGTPGGVGHAQEPKRYLQEGELLTTTIEGLGQLNNRVVKEA